MLGGPQQALRALSATIEMQALTMTFIDLFWILTAGVVIVSPLILFLRPLQRGRIAAAMH